MFEKTISSRFFDAREMEKSGNYASAISEYRAILAQDSGIQEAHLNLGYVYSRMGRFEEAVICYKEALLLGGNYLVYFNLGSICYKMGSYKEAVINLERSRKLNGRFALATLVIGLCYSRMKNIRAAEVNFRKVLDIWPANKVALTALAIMYYYQARYEESLELLEKLTASYKNDNKLREFRSRVLYKSGRYDESVEEIKRVSRDSEGYRLYNEFIRLVPVEVLTDRYGTIDEKIDLLEKKAHQSNGNLISLSLCHLFRGDTDQALDYLYQVKRSSVN